MDFRPLSSLQRVQGCSCVTPDGASTETCAVTAGQIAQTTVTRAIAVSPAMVCPLSPPALSPPASSYCLIPFLVQWPGLFLPWFCLVSFVALFAVHPGRKTPFSLLYPHPPHPPPPPWETVAGRRVSVSINRWWCRAARRCSDGTASLAAVTAQAAAGGFQLILLLPSRMQRHQPVHVQEQVLQAPLLGV